MITPDFSGQRVRSQPGFGQSHHRTAEGEHKHVHSPERKRHDRTRQRGHILIEKHSHERRSRGDESPHIRRWENPTNLQGQSRSSPSPTKQHFDVAQELHNVNENLALCYEELNAGYVKEIARNVGLNNVNSGNLHALTKLLQQLMNEMVYLKEILSQYITSCGQVDSIEKPQKVSDIPGPNDLVYLKGPVTENTISTTLQARFNASCFHTNIGPVQLIINSNTDSSESKDDTSPSYANSIVTKPLEQLFERRIPQILILSGESASGKSHTAQMLIKEFMNLSCGPSQTDLVKQLNATVTVLDSLGKAKTLDSPEASKMAILYEFHFNNKVVHRTYIRYIPVSMSRVVQPREDESNFRIFYQLFAGLNPKDRAKLQLQTHNADELRCLYNYPSHDSREIDLLQKQFQSWKSALQVLAIPFTDVTKVLAAILLLGNVQFIEKSPRVLEVQGGDFELKAVALLLGVPYISLFRGLTKKLKVMKSDATIQSCSATQANHNRDSLAKTLYSRMLSAIVRRCNCSRKSTPSEANITSESLTKSYDFPTMNKSQVSDGNTGTNERVIAFPNIDVQDQVFGIADLFGFERPNCNGMEQICANLCSETIQHFYTTHIFKSAEGYCREEGIQNKVDVDYLDNSQCIELLTCQETGILTYLDHETVKNGTTEKFVEKVRSQHSDHNKFFTTNCESNEFGIAHHTGEVIYDADDLLRGNDDSIADDVVQMFSSEQCSFGFAVHLFASDLKSVSEKDASDDKGMAERFGSSKLSPVQTFSQEFQEKLDELLKILIHADPWFILCLKSNLNGRASYFDPEIVSRQMKSLQIFETVHLFRSGYTHRMRVIPFAQRYFVHDEELNQTDALEIALSYQKFLNESKRENPCKIFYVGRKHVFFSEVLWRELEKNLQKRHHFEDSRRNGFETSGVSALPTDLSRNAVHLRSEYKLRFTATNFHKIFVVNEGNATKTLYNHSTPKEEIHSYFSQKDTSRIFSQDESLETIYSRVENRPSTPPALPKRRGYTVIDNKKIAFPQMRVMTEDYRDVSTGHDVVFSSGESIKVTGASPKAGYLAVESRHKTGWVPYKLTRLMTEDVM